VELAGSATWFVLFPELKMLSDIFKLNKTVIKKYEKTQNINFI